MKTTTTPAALASIKLELGPTVTFAPAPEHFDADQILMSRAFDLVSPAIWGAADWRAPVLAVLTDADLTAAGVTLEQVTAAVEFFTATKATVVTTNAHIIRAEGYRAGPAGT